MHISTWIIEVMWKRFSREELKNFISKEYQAREIIVFGYDESIEGWQQGFQFVSDSGARWDLKEIAIVPLREDAMLVIISATMVIQNKSLKKENIFFQT
jgi:hypothetical protein